MDYWFGGLNDYCVFFNCLVDIVVLLSSRHSCLGIPSPFKRGLLKDLVLHFSTSKLKAKQPPSATTLFMLKYNVVLQGVAMEGWQHHFRSLFFRGGSFPSFGRSMRKTLNWFSDLGMWPMYSTSPTAQSLAGTASFLAVLQWEGWNPWFWASFLGKGPTLLLES